MLIGLLLTALFVILNGFFVGAEFALVKLRATQIERLARLDTSAAKATVEVCKRLDRYLSATQLGITLASLGLGSVAEPHVAHALDGVFQQFGLVKPVWGQISHALSFTVLTGAHILFGELLPKLIAISSAEKMALSVARPLRIFYWIAFPGLLVLNGLSSLLLRALGFPSLHDAEGALSEEEILGVMSQAYAKGTFSDDKRKLLERVMRFTELTARQVMVPRVDVVFFDAELSVEETLSRARSHGFTRYPVVEGGNLDKVIGYVTIKDFGVEPRPTTLRRAMREPMIVPETMSLIELMRDMQRKQMHIAIVVDEYGGASGIATLEDVLEEIVGEIRDEHDEETARVSADVNGVIVADGLATINDLIAGGVLLPDDIEGETAGGVVMAALGRFARPGDVARIGDYEIRVEGVRRRRVTKVTIKRLEKKSTPPTEAEAED